MTVQPNTDAELCVELLSELVTIASPSGEEHAAASFLAERLSRLDATDVKVLDGVNVVATVSGRRPGPRRAFLTHLDTVRPGADDTPPIVSIADGAEFGKPGQVVRGIGAAAPKSAVAAMVTGLSAVAADRASLAGSVQLVAVSKDLAAEHAGLREVVAHQPLEADWAVVGEPSDNAIVVGARGIAHVRVCFSGVAAHCGMPSAASNPLYGIADLLRALRAMELPHHPDLGAATLAPFEASAAGTPPQTPSSGSVVVDRRILPDEDTDLVIGELTKTAADAAAATPGLTSDVTVLKTMYPFAVSAADPFVEAVWSTIADVAGRDPDVTSIAFSSNAGYTTRVLGIPSVAFGPGRIVDIGDGEHVSIDQLTEATRVYAALMVSDLPTAR